MISIVVPAYNEEGVIRQTLRTLLASAAAVGEPFEVIVVDDASTDRTAAIARSLGARVVPVHLRRIAAVRNAGARASHGSMLLFVDADTLVPPEALASAIAAMRNGAVGGGARIFFDGGLPTWLRVAWPALSWSMAAARLTGGCFIFARRDAFEAVGGFDERYFASEEIHLALALRSMGRFVIVRDTVVTSGRKFRIFSGREILRQLFLLTNIASWKKRERLDLWYGGRRETAGSDGSAAGPMAGGEPTVRRTAAAG